MVALKPLYIKPSDIIKMRSTLKSFLRDWSSEVLLIKLNLYSGQRRKRLMLQTYNG